MKTLEKISAPYSSAEVFERNDDRFGRPGQDDRCLLCNAPMNAEKARYEVRLACSGGLLPVDADWSEDDDQGFFVVGNCCAKRVPRGYKSRR